MSRNNKKDTVSTVEDDDPYAQIAQDNTNTLEATQKESSRMRKWNKLKQRFNHDKQAVKQGFMMGCMVGGGFGLVMGLVAAFQYKSLLVIPLTTLGSAASFGFFMACGTFIRTHPFDENAQLNLIRYNMAEAKYEASVPMWKLKYMNMPTM